MKLPTLSVVVVAVAVAALTSSVAAVITMPIAHAPGSAVAKKRHLSSRATITESLLNNVTGGNYIAQVAVGNPPQMQYMAIDTGSSDGWVLSAYADYCVNPKVQGNNGGCSSVFDGNLSSTFKLLEKQPFKIRYADNSNAFGEYMTDDFTIGSATIKGLQLAYVNHTTLGEAVLGIGYEAHEITTGRLFEQVPYTYPNLVSQMVTQGLIPTKAYSLYLNSFQQSTGSILFGGLDRAKYSGPLFTLPIVPDVVYKETVYDALQTTLSGFSYTNQAGKETKYTNPLFNITAIFDSGTDFTFLPNSIVEPLHRDLNVFVDPRTYFTYCACALRDSQPDLTFNFHFGDDSIDGITINVPVTEVILDLPGIFSDMPPITISGIPGKPCAFAIGSGDLPGRPANGPYFLGDTFLRSAYVVYDLDNNEISVAQTNFNSNSTEIYEFQRGPTAIPHICAVGAASPTAALNHSMNSTSKTSASAQASFDGMGLVASIWTAFVVLGATFLLAWA